jgi:molecular chaperone GrpE
MSDIDKREESTTTAAEPPATEAPEAEPGLEELKRLLAEKTQEAQECHEKLLRYAAELENIKKRAERERAELVQYANEAVFRELLPVLDNLERALENGRQFEAPPGLMEGLELVRQEFLKVLQKFGVAPVESLGQPFDPAYHHAVMEEEAPELADQTVTKELQRGYLFRTRLLRPAMVVVARSGNKPASPSIDISA